MDLQQILKEEPIINDLLIEAKNVGKSKLSRKDKDLYWYHDMKHRMMSIVGFNCDNPKLQNSDSYDVVYQKLIKLMGI